ncbi:MAG: DUF4214 domain-containing protein [Sulfitobacter sp.]
MDTTDAFAQAFAQISSLGSFGGVAPPSSPDDIFNLTVGEYRAYLDAAELSFSSFDASYFANLLNNPAISESLDPGSRAILENFAAGDFSAILGPINEARALVAPFPEDTLLSDALGINGGGGGSGFSAEVEQAFADAQANLANLLWDDQNGIFNSPTFTVDFDTGNWFAQNGTAEGAYSGSTLAEFFGLLGQAVGSAILSFIGTNESVVNQLIDDGANATKFAEAQAAAQTAATQTFASLQSLAAEIIADANADPAGIEAQATAQFEALFNAVADILPGATSTLNKFMLGSRNSDPTFVTSLQGDLNGSDEGDWFFLSKESNSFDGGRGTDVLFGLEGNDSLNGGADDDFLFGGAGDGDMASFAGSLGQYTLKMSRDGSVTAQDRNENGEGTDLLTGIETLSFGSGASIFGDGTVDLTKFQGIAGLSAEDINTFVELYIAYFNRAPDAVGLNFWGTAFATGTSLDDIAALFLDQDETRATYPSDTSNLEFATQVYQNVLGRTPDEGGLAFWQGQLDSGNVSQGTFILEVLKGAKADLPAGSAQADIDLQLADRGYLASKTDIGTYFAVIKGLSDVTDASDAMQLFVRGSDTSIQEAIAKIDAEYGAALADGSGELVMQLVGVADDPFAV